MVRAAAAGGRGQVLLVGEHLRHRPSRTQVDRLLDPDNPNVLLGTVQKAAAVVGKRVSIALENVSR